VLIRMAVFWLIAVRTASVRLIERWRDPVCEEAVETRLNPRERRASERRMVFIPEIA
jgi:hypothetical protein